VAVNSFDLTTALSGALCGICNTIIREGENVVSHARAHPFHWSCVQNAIKSVGQQMVFKCGHPECTFAATQIGGVHVSVLRSEVLRKELLGDLRDCAYLEELDSSRPQSAFSSRDFAPPLLLPVPKLGARPKTVCERKKESRPLIEKTIVDEWAHMAYLEDFDPAPSFDVACQKKERAKLMYFWASNSSSHVHFKDSATILAIRGLNIEDRTSIFLAAVKAGADVNTIKLLTPESSISSEEYVRAIGIAMRQGNVPLFEWLISNAGVSVLKEANFYFIITEAIAKFSVNPEYLAAVSPKLDSRCRAMAVLCALDNRQIPAARSLLERGPIHPEKAEEVVTSALRFERQSPGLLDLCNIAKDDEFDF